MRTLFQISRFHIICIGAVTTLTFGWLLTGHDLLWPAVAVCATDWFQVNLMNRMADLAEDRRNGISGTAFVARHDRALTVGAMILLVRGALPDQLPRLSGCAGVDPDRLGAPALAGGVLLPARADLRDHL